MAKHKSPQSPPVWTVLIRTLRAVHALFKWTAAILFAAQTLESLVGTLAGAVDAIGGFVESLATLVGPMLAG